MDSVPLDSVEGDRQGLVALYNQCNGKNWKKKENWLTDKPIEDWEFVHVHWPRWPNGGRLHSIFLCHNNLTGSLPKEIGNWTQVKTFNLENNNLTGSLPREIGNWTCITRVMLQNNLLTGGIELPINFKYKKQFYTCYIRRWVLRERKRLFLCLV